MRIIITILLSILTILKSHGQIATIKDQDGWTNVRVKPSGQSEIIYRVNEGELFWYDSESDSNFADWVKVYISKDKYSLNHTDKDLVTGFIHKSRLLPIDSLDQYKGNDFKFEYFVTDYVVAENELKLRDGQWPSYLNGRYMWGTDGSQPYNKIDSIKVSINEIEILVDPNLHNDLFNLRSQVSIYKVNNFFIVHDWQSDGAGAYELAWVIDKNGIVQRLVISII